MIIDCDTHIIPRDVFDSINMGVEQIRPLLHFDDAGLYTHSDFLGAPPLVPGTTPLPSFSQARGGSGTDLLGMTDIEVRLKDCQRLGVDRQVLLPQFRGIIRLTSQTAYFLFTLRVGSGGFTAEKIARATLSGVALSLMMRVSGRPLGCGFGAGLVMALSLYAAFGMTGCLPSKKSSTV